MLTTAYTLGAPFVDVDEQRSDPIPHRYVHGGFDGNETRFSCYFPTRERYEGRFLHHIGTGFGGDENASSAADIEFAFSCGGYLVESNQGHRGLDLSGSGGDERVHGYVASLESARFARELATEIYGGRPHHGYLHGGSGGAHRAVVCLENGEGEWDAAVAIVLPSTVGGASAAACSAVCRATVLLAPFIDEVIDAMEPGGSGNPFVPGLTTDAREALECIYRMGFPRGAESTLKHHMFAAAPSLWAFYAPEITRFDPSYFEDAPGSTAPHLVDERAKVTSVTDNAIGVDHDDLSSLLGARITVLTGVEAGRSRYCAYVQNNQMHALALANDVWGDLAAGDDIRIDNREFIAFCNWHRDRRALYELPVVRKPEKIGSFDGKLIVIQSTLDAGAWPLDAIHYHELVRAHDRDVDFRLWFTENAAHGLAASPHDLVPVPSTRVVDFSGIVQQAICAVIDWTEAGVAPAQGSTYSYRDGQLSLAESANKRLGVQPVATLTVNGASHAEATPEEEVRFEVSVACPPGGGTVIAADIDFEGTGAWAYTHDGIDGTRSALRFAATHRYPLPGTYFPAVCVTAHRDGDVEATSRRLSNLARARVTVRQRGT
jgi:hypothetical protein